MGVDSLVVDEADDPVALAGIRGLGGLGLQVGLEEDGPAEGRGKAALDPALDHRGQPLLVEPQLAQGLRLVLLLGLVFAPIAWSAPIHIARKEKL
jgi:hypothetical protein